MGFGVGFGQVLLALALPAAAQQHAPQPMVSILPPGFDVTHPDLPRCGAGAALKFSQPRYEVRNAAEGAYVLVVGSTIAGLDGIYRINRIEVTPRPAGTAVDTIFWAACWNHKGRT